MVKEQEAKFREQTRPNRHTKLQTVFTLSKELAQDYITKSYADRNNLVIHYVMPSSYAGYDVCFSYDLD